MAASMNDEYLELRSELKEVVKEMRAGHMTQVEILTELRVVKPRVEKLENEIEKLKIFMWKVIGVLTAANAVGWPAVIYMLTTLGKH